MQKQLSLTAVILCVGHQILAGTSQAQVVDRPVAFQPKAAIPEKIGRPLPTENVGMVPKDEPDLKTGELKLEADIRRPASDFQDVPLPSR